MIRFDARSGASIVGKLIAISFFSVSLGACTLESSTESTGDEVTDTTEQASAYGYAAWGTQVYKDIPIPSGELFGAIEGDGVHVTAAGGSFASVGNLCNWHIDVDFYNSSGTRTQQLHGTNHASCAHTGLVKGETDLHVSPGRACVRLYTAFDHRLASVCHNIVR